MTPVMVSSQILDVGTPIELPAAAPVEVRAHAVAMAYLIEQMADGVKADSHSAVKAADRALSFHKVRVQGAGWELLGIVTLCDGSKGWKLVVA